MPEDRQPSIFGDLDLQEDADVARDEHGDQAEPVYDSAAAADLSDDPWIDAEREYARVLMESEAVKIRLDDAKAALLDLTPESGRKGEILQVIRTAPRKGSTDWKAAAATLLGGDVEAIDAMAEKFRKPDGDPGWSIRMQKMKETRR